MTCAEFIEAVRRGGWTVRQLRSDDAPPTDDLMDRVGLQKYERYVLRYEKDAATGEGVAR